MTHLKTLPTGEVAHARLGVSVGEPPSTPPIAYVPLTAVDVRDLVAGRSGAGLIRDIEGIAHLVVRVPGFTAHELQTLAELLPAGDETAGNILVPSRLIEASDTMAPGSRGRAAEIQAGPLIDLFGPDHFGFRVLNTLRSLQFALRRVEELTEVCRHQDADVSEDCLTCRNLNLALRRSQENRRKEGAEWRTRVAELRGDLRGEYNALVERTRLMLQAEHDDLRRAQEQLVLAEVDRSKARRDLAVLAAEQGQLEQDIARLRRENTRLEAENREFRGRRTLLDAMSFMHYLRGQGPWGLVGDWEAFRDVVGAFERGQPVPCQLFVSATRLDGGGSGAPFPEPSTPSTPSVLDRGLAQDRPAPGDELPRPALGRLPRDQGPSRDDVTEDRQGRDVPGILVSIRGSGADGSSASGARDHSAASSSATTALVPGPQSRRQSRGSVGSHGGAFRRGIAMKSGSVDSTVRLLPQRAGISGAASRDIEVVEIADDSDLDTDVGLDSSGTRMSSDGSRQVRPVGYAPETNRRSARYRAIDSDADPPRPVSEIQCLLPSGCALEDVRLDLLEFMRMVPERRDLQQSQNIVRGVERPRLDAGAPPCRLSSVTEASDSELEGVGESKRSVGIAGQGRLASTSQRDGDMTGPPHVVQDPEAEQSTQHLDQYVFPEHQQALGSRDVELPEPGAPSWIVYGVHVTRTKVRHGGLQSLGFPDYQCLRGSLHLVQKRLLTGDYIGLLTVTSMQPLLPCDIMFQRRITVFWFFKQYSAMSPGLRSLVIEYVAQRRAFWERTHWVEIDRSDPTVSQLYADPRRRQRAWDGAWKALRAQMEKLPESADCPLAEQLELLDSREPARAYWSVPDSSARIAESVDAEVWSARVDNADDRASRVIPVPPAMPPVP
ncbi:hypothetical protein PHYSODRAFT_339226 [Phytophthora sojae]|uniref:Uncharacterized protein n=1 Tax=Phytophthora sojae (strain P6497) TaxID=1094619 RepID=G5A638_PHYSP|nr:hypothetical protein PHYSODRAFT_339226 [Phytophthora sojae]EGZ08793.1 hypothetical protein PHYSODRAFT_339226 [Phytophthora sojae]|eukprot:XP_009535426.1 hypothetical protein PHYSODRAFT_339226 [Phytophthora sojae]